MQLDLLSIIVGGVLWELIAAYIHFVAKPKIMKAKEKRKGLLMEGPKQMKEDGYNETAIGFNCKLKKDAA